MECCVYAPSGAYEIAFRYTPDTNTTNSASSSSSAAASEDAGTITLTVTPRHSARRAAAAAAPTLGKDTADSGHQFHQSYNQDDEGDEAEEKSVYYEACLRQAAVHQITCQAGVRKSVTAFAEMLHAALVGTRQQKQHLTFSIETVSQLRSRITEEMRRQQQQQQQQQPPPAAAANLSLLELSLQSEDGLKVEDLLKQMVFVLDYRVDFTRALFTIPLQTQTKQEQQEEEEEDQEVVVEEVVPTTKTSAARGLDVYTKSNKKETGTVEDDDDLLLLEQMKQKLEEAHLTIHHLSKENKSLKKENEALVRLSREKMLEMQNVCNDFAKKAEDFAQIDYLKKKNAELRVKVEKLERQLQAQQQEKQQRRPYSSHHARRGNSDEGHNEHFDDDDDDEEGAASFSSAPLRRPVHHHQHREGSRSPSIRSRQGSTERQDTRAPSVEGNHYRRSGGRRPSPLLSPTLTPIAERRRVKEETYRGRFDTPPHAQAHSTSAAAARQGQKPSQRLSRAPSTGSAASGPPAQQRRSGSSTREYHYGPTTTATTKPQAYHQKSKERSGGDSPAPRGRSGNRPVTAAAKWTKKHLNAAEEEEEEDRFLDPYETEERKVRQSVKRRFASPATNGLPTHKPRTKKRSSAGGSNSSNNSYHGSSCSSRASSSCERLYQTPTASSKQREAEVYRPELSRRAVFR